MAVTTTSFDRPVRSRVKQLLEDLGNSPSTIARYLAGLTVQGTPGNSTDCAIARFLSAVVASEADCRRVRVFRRTVVVRTRGVVPWTVVRLPRPVRVFITAFDAGSYPELVRRETQERGNRVALKGYGGSHPGEVA